MLLRAHAYEIQISTGIEPLRAHDTQSAIGKLGLEIFDVFRRWCRDLGWGCFSGRLDFFSRGITHHFHHTQFGKRGNGGFL